VRSVTDAAYYNHKMRGDGKGMHGVRHDFNEVVADIVTDQGPAAPRYAVLALRDDLRMHFLYVPRNVVVSEESAYGSIVQDLDARMNTCNCLCYDKDYVGADDRAGRMKNSISERITIMTMCAAPTATIVVWIQDAAAKVKAICIALGYDREAGNLEHWYIEYVCGASPNQCCERVRGAAQLCTFVAMLGGILLAPHESMDPRHNGFFMLTDASEKPGLYGNWGFRELEDGNVCTYGGTDAHKVAIRRTIDALIARMAAHGHAPAAGVALSLRF
jgi:hypothetical protein